MRRFPALGILLLFSVIASAQRFHAGIFGGLSAYTGDLVDRLFPKKVTNAAIGITGNYELADQFMLRGGFTYSVVGGADRFSADPSLVTRNLSFETSIYEFSAVMEYYLNNLYDRRFSPYGFAGLAVYHFNPYAYYAGQKVFLKPLSTEGQGLPGYNIKPYSLTQMAIPFGAGVKFRINDNLRVGLEFGYRKLFTDYLDDLSGSYADPADLLAAKGQLAVDISYRGDELPGGNPAYPLKSTGRGRQDRKDAYYFTGIHLTYRLGGRAAGLPGGSLKKNTGCPVNVY
jgi:opacity protein-like surface antigen